MTTVQIMLNWARTLALACLATLIVSGCAKPTRGQLEPPEVLLAPYDTVKGEALWALAPLANESGVSFVDPLAVSDTLVNAVTQVRGLSCLPMNRTLAALRALGGTPVSTPQGARALANALGVDGVIVGSITAYDPYDPPKLGLTLALFVRDSGKDDEVLDPIKLQTAYSENNPVLQTQFLDKPAAVVSEHLDAANHEVQMNLRRYAAGRSDPDSALGWRSGLVSMDLYTQFACHHMVSRLLETERLRLAQPRHARPTSR